MRKAIFPVFIHTPCFNPIDSGDIRIELDVLTEKFNERALDILGGYEHHLTIPFQQVTLHQAEA